jgi:hypothetical protein
MGGFRATCFFLAASERAIRRDRSGVNSAKTAKLGRTL